MLKKRKRIVGGISQTRGEISWCDREVENEKCKSKIAEKRGKEPGYSAMCVRE